MVRPLDDPRDWQGGSMNRFTEKVAIVTGSGNGLGEEYAKRFAAEGAAVVVADVDEAAGARVAGEIVGDGGRAYSVPVDVTDEDAVARMVVGCVERYGGVDILVNNAGLLHGRWNTCVELSADDWRRIFDVNVIAHVICAAACRNSMKERGGGVVINISSSAAYSNSATAYAVSKVAVNGMTMALATDLAKDGIRVNGLAPGMTDTPINRTRRPQSMVDQVLEGQLIKRMGQMSEPANLLLFLCSDEAAFITGQTILVDGGYCLHF
jgi:NAD(P)-dependent dehydrogenase (short-subunit alcohol dehydrogenase family)